MKRVLLLNNVPAPYFNPLFARLGREADWALTVCYVTDWSRNLGWQEQQVEHSPTHRTFILDQQSSWLKLGRSFAAATALLMMLLRKRPDYLISYGYTLLPQLTALAWAMLTTTPFAVIGDANYHLDTATGLKRVFKSLWLRRVAQRAAALPTIGTANRRFWEAYGARAEQLFEARFAVDNDFYARALQERADEIEALRQTLKLRGKTVFLFVGRLVKRKNVDLLIQAAQQLDDERVVVLVVGAGEERPALEALAAGDPRVIFAGNVAPADLPLYYGVADALVLPARQEPWGLVVNEAMACGLAVIAHRHCGATVDLVSAENGVTLETFSATELAAALQLIARDEARKRAMQQASRAKIQAWSIEAAARGIAHAVAASAAAPAARWSAPGLEQER